MKSFLLVLLSLCLAGCIGVLGPDLPPPTNIGDHPVGVTSIEVTDVVRGRTLPVEVWYPAAHREVGVSPVVYEVEALGVAVAQLRSPAGARRDTSPWRNGGPRPVVLLSHGATSTRFANVSLSEVLASHGYIVVAPDHPGHTTADAVLGVSEAVRAQSALDRPKDLSKVLDTLELLSAKRTGFFRGLIDGQRVAVAGHSFGGRTALAMVGARFDVARERSECLVDDSDRDCAALPVFGAASGSKPYRYRDPRVKAALAIAPAGFEFYREDGIAQVDAPVLVVGAGRDQRTPYAEKHRPLYDALTGPRYLLDLKDAGHLTATDVCDIVASTGFLGAFGGKDAKDGCGPDYMSTRLALEVVSDASLAFFGEYLAHEPGSDARLARALDFEEHRHLASDRDLPIQRW